MDRVRWALKLCERGFRTTIEMKRSHSKVWVVFKCLIFVSAAINGAQVAKEVILHNFGDLEQIISINITFNGKKLFGLWTNLFTNSTLERIKFENQVPLYFCLQRCNYICYFLLLLLSWIPLHICKRKANNKCISWNSFHEIHFCHKKYVIQS